MQCKNCNSSLLDESDYCYSCGGKVIRNRLTLKNLFEHFSETFLNYDNKFLQTFITLFKNPENVIGSYINGTRKKYVNVLSYFALALTITGLEWFILRKYFPDAIDLSNLDLGNNKNISNTVFQTIQENMSIIMMLFVPVYALISRLVFFNRKEFNYTEHLVIFMYILAQLSIFGAILNIIGAVIGTSLGQLAYLNLPIQILYSAYCLKRLYKLSLQGIILRTLLFIGIFIISYIVVIFAIVGIMFLIEGPDFFKKIMETQQATG
ncbi:DUF3667 domain-containing protein [Hyunsoonleella aestuarii]|uniref:DUF3667 domain-containing protein n=1 Tax=Hyunsoonleella aestuarii TaxID=912802 RepID=A0ABP8EC56_9FLAO|nr:DUF3667 domain-containing protein [Hyunsoonleella aestuarii]